MGNTIHAGPNRLGLFFQLSLFVVTMNVFQTVVPKGNTTAAPAISLRPGDIIAANGKVIRKKTLDTRQAPVVSVPMTREEREAYRHKRFYDDRWEAGRSSLHRSF